VAGPLVAAIGCCWRPTLAVGAVAVTLAVGRSGGVDMLSTGQDIVRVGSVVVGSGLAVLIAALRSRVETAAARAGALAQDNARLYAEAGEALGLLDVIFEHAPVGLALLDTELRYVRVNDCLAEINGVRQPSTSGTRSASCCRTCRRACTPTRPT
jgi:hypothetical protein